MRFFNLFYLFFLSLGLTLSPKPSWSATVTGINVLSGSSTSPVVDGNTVKIYAGWANATSTICNNYGSTSNCDTCVGGVNVPCNRASIHKDLALQIEVSSSTANISGLPVKFSTASDSLAGFTSVATRVASASGYSISITWSELCSNLSSNSTSLGSDCTALSLPYFHTQTIYFGPVKDSKFLETISVEINLSVMDSTVSTYTECPSGTTGSEGGAACYFKMFGGDEKAFVDILEPSWNVDNPLITVGSSQAPIRAVSFFAQEIPVASVSNTSYNAITNLSDYFELPIQSGEDVLPDNRLNGLENGVNYCFKMATQDITGNNFRFTGTPSKLSDVCVEANEVVGILSDKNCFIASAAFGSSLNRHVQRFREFRNQFLLRQDWGKKFVKLYYEYGPQGASWIQKNQFLRGLTRGVLWPLLGVVEIFLHYGVFWGTLSAILVSLTLLSILTFFSYLFIWLIWKKILRFKKLKLPARSLFFFLFLIVFWNGSAQGAVDEFNEFQDESPKDPPYTNTEEPDLVQKKPLREVRENKKISHPESSRGLYLIDELTGKYYYKTKRKTKRESTTSLRVGTYEAPSIVSTAGGTQFSFSDVYTDSAPVFFMYDYEWSPFKKFQQLSLQLGGGFFFTQGSGILIRTPPQTPIEAKEQYTFVALPFNLGLTYRFQFSSKQWLVPLYISGGGTYFLLAELRDDGKGNHFVGSPAAYGAGGLMFSLSSLDRETSFILDNEYGINNLWITAEFRVYQSFSEDLDMSSNVINFGVTMDY